MIIRYFTENKLIAHSPQEIIPPIGSEIVLPNPNENGIWVVYKHRYQMENLVSLGARGCRIAVVDVFIR